MQVFVVGGFVRDKLLGLKSVDKDFVVVGSSIQKMQDLGYQQVGKDFPVFLHPKTKQEYALARIERKISKGYKGFEFDTKSVSLKEDLSRRDLTINAIAMSVDGEIIDYFGGQKDLQLGILRHISSSFCEDPVRVLRVARFAAKFKNFGFKVAHSTHKLMQQMVESGEVDNLVSERVFAELNKALSYNTPSAFFKTLANCGGFKSIFGVEKDINLHKNNFEFLDNLNTENEIKFALWLLNYQDFEIKNICKKLSVPKKYKELAVFGNGFKGFAANFENKTPSQKLEFFNKTDSTRRVERFDKILKVWQLVGIDTKNITQTNTKIKNIDIKKMNMENIIIELKNAKLKICSSL